MSETQAGWKVRGGQHVSGQLPPASIGERRRVGQWTAVVRSGSGMKLEHYQGAWKAHLCFGGTKGSLE